MHEWKTSTMNTAATVAAAVSDSAHTMHWLHGFRVIESAIDTGEIRVSLYKLQPGGDRLTHIMEIPKSLTATEAVDMAKRIAELIHEATPSGARTSGLIAQIGKLTDRIMEMNEANRWTDPGSVYQCSGGKWATCADCGRLVRYCDEHEVWDHASGAECFMTGPNCNDIGADND